MMSDLVPQASPVTAVTAEAALTNLQQRVLRAAVERRDLSDLEVQRDVVSGAERLHRLVATELSRLRTLQLAPDPALLDVYSRINDYRHNAQAALWRVEGRTRRLGAGPRALGAGE